jgi:hypothetical protein
MYILLCNQLTGSKSAVEQNQVPIKSGDEIGLFLSNLNKIQVNIYQKSIINVLFIVISNTGRARSSIRFLENLNLIQ